MNQIPIPATVPTTYKDFVTIVPGIMQNRADAPRASRLFFTTDDGVGTGELLVILRTKSDPTHAFKSLTITIAAGVSQTLAGDPDDRFSHIVSIDGGTDIFDLFGLDQDWEWAAGLTTVTTAFANPTVWVAMDRDV